MTYPLQSWTLRGFRSIRDETTFELAGLNVLVGANSAGKSSVLHSILLTAQTLGNPLVDRALLLNGPLVRLGLAEDTVHEESHKAIEIGFGLSPQFRRLGWRAGMAASYLELRATFAMTRDKADFALDQVRLHGIARDEDIPDQRMLVSSRTLGGAKQAFRRAGLKGKAVDVAARLESLGVEGDVSARAAGARVRQFLPEYLLEVFNTYENELAEMQWHYMRLRRASLAQRQRAELRRPVLDFIRRYLVDTGHDEEAATIPLRQSISIEHLAESVGPHAWQELQTLTATEWFEEHREDLEFEGAVSQVELGEVLKDGIEWTRRWFERSVRHLGPLRASPQPLYNLPEAASGTSVGREGEYTAAVLSAYARRPVAVPDPEGDGVIELPLGDAVNSWMAKLGLLSAVRSEERGKLGFELHLSVEGVDRDLDLTTVGVGVSQALPIVVLGLLADPGSLLLFEQPELHLHPDVQAALGDFFLALARADRQIIVETHSEYLINRLRRREATDPNAGVAGLVRLFFFERAGSTSSVKVSRIGPGGSMPAWPKGFLDTAAREIQAMVESSSS